MAAIGFGFILGFLFWFFVRYVLSGFYTINQNERAVKTRFGRANRLGDNTTLEDPVSDYLNKKDRERYSYPLVRVIQPGGPYYRWPWEKIHKVTIATQTM